MNLKPQFHLAPCAPGLFVTLVSVVTVGLHDCNPYYISKSRCSYSIVSSHICRHPSVPLLMCLECALEKSCVQVTAIASEFAAMDNFLEMWCKRREPVPGDVHSILHSWCPKSRIQDFGLPKYWIQDFGSPKSWIQHFSLPKSWIQDFGLPKSLIQDFGMANPEFRILEYQNIEFRILAFQNLKFKILQL